MSHQEDRPPLDAIAPHAEGRSAWTPVAALVITATAARIIWLIVACPYELVADEAHYWEWGRHLDWSYYTKGPGVGWIIAASTAVLGDMAWAVRLPAALAGALTMLAAASLAMHLAPGRARAGLYTAALVALIPIHQGLAIFMTIDGPYLACWIIAAAAAWRALDACPRPQSPDPSTAPSTRATSARQSPAIGAWPFAGWCAGLGAAVGIGFLFKYTILLLAVGLIIYVIAQRRALSFNGAAARGLAMGLIVFAICVSPVVIWNIGRGWPTVSHLLGHVHAPGGDVTVPETWSYDPMWTLEFIGSQLGLVGPPALVVMFLAVRAAWRARRGSAQRWAGQLFLLCCAAPILLFYFLLSFVTDVEGNWPVAGYITLAVLGGMYLAEEIPRYRRLVREWRAIDPPRPKRGVVRGRPETAGQIAWHWTLGWGIVAAVAIAFGPYVAHVPGVGRWVPTHRIVGHRAKAERIDAFRQQHAPAELVVDHYGKASLLAFYLSDQPRVFSGAHALGSRRSAYDFFAETDLYDPALHGRDMLLIGGRQERWAGAYHFDSIEPLVIEPKLYVYLGRGYGGVIEATWRE